MTHPWEMRDDETDNAFEAFRTYRDLGAKRSIRAAGAILRKNLTTLGEWSVKYDWPNRARAFDKWADQQATQAWLDQRRAQVEETNQLGHMLVASAVRRVHHADQAGRAIPGDAIRAAEVAAKIQSLGMTDLRPESQAEKESGVMVDAAALVEEMYRRAADQGRSDGGR